MFKISCLCLDKRKDMWLKLRDEIKRNMNMNMETFVVGTGDDTTLSYDHIDTNKIEHSLLYYGCNPLSHYNAFLSHKKMAQRAIDEKIEKLLILEDDSYIISNRIYLLNSQRFCDFYNRNDWDILYLGWWLKKTGLISEDREDLEERWSKNKEFGIDPIPHPPEMQHEICGLHGILINQHFLPIIANAQTGPIDSLLNHNFDKIKAYYFWPKLIQCYTTWSYCENGITRRNQI